MARNPAGNAGISVQVPADIYVGKNVVRKHLVEFYYRAASQKLLTEHEEVLAVFDSVILEPNGRRLGGLTLHDYVILTNLNLITWGRGRIRDMIDKVAWPDVTLMKYGRRTVLEGVVKVGINSKGDSSKRRISIRAKDDEEELSGGTAPAASGKAKATLYLDLVPIEDVKILARMINFLSNGGAETPSMAAFGEQFKSDLAASTERLTTINPLLKPFYIQQPNGVWVEADYYEEEYVYHSVPQKFYRGAREVPSPYKLGLKPGSSSRPAPAPKPSPRPVAKPAPAPAPKSISVSPTSKLDKLGGADWGNLSLAAPVAPAAKPAPAPAPGPAAAPAQRSTATPVTGVVVPVSGSGSEVVVRPASADQNALTMPIAVAVGREALNIYSISRLARGLWFTPVNLSRNIGDTSHIMAMITDLFELVTGNPDDRRQVLDRLRQSVDNGALSNNILLHYTVYPFLKPLMNFFVTKKEDQPAKTKNKLQVRGAPDAAAPIVQIEAPKVTLPPAAQKLLEMGEETATEKKAEPAPAPVAKVEPPKPEVKPEPPKPEPAPAPVAKVEPPKPEVKPEPPKPEPAPAPVAKVEPPKPEVKPEPPKPAVTPAPAPAAKVEPPKPEVKPEPLKPAVTPTPAPVAKVEPPKPEVKAEPPKPAPAPAPVAKVEPPKPEVKPEPPKPAPAPAPVAKVEPPKPEVKPEPPKPAPTPAPVAKTEPPKPAPAPAPKPDAPTGQVKVVPPAPKPDAPTGQVKVVPPTPKPEGPTGQVKVVPPAPKPEGPTGQVKNVPPPAPKSEAPTTQVKVVPPAPPKEEDKGDAPAKPEDKK